MAVETLGEACSQGWRVTVRCAYGRSEGPHSQSSRECNYRKELDMETLVWTRGRAFPLSRLESRLRCPRCGSRYVVVLYQPPRLAAPPCADRDQKRAGRYLCALDDRPQYSDKRLDNRPQSVYYSVRLLIEGSIPDAILFAEQGAAPARGLANRSRADPGSSLRYVAPDGC